VGEIGGSKITGERATEGRGAELLPEPAVKTSRFETRHALGVEAESELVTVDQGEAGARSRQLSPQAHELESGVDQLEGDRWSIHDSQLAALRGE
jgi:hypothetical protein